MKNAGISLIAAAAVLSLVGVFQTHWITTDAYAAVGIRCLSFFFFLYLLQKAGFWLLHREP